MQIIKPRFKFPDQPQTITPVVSDNTLVDDLIVLVDDPVALVGGQTSIYKVMRSTIKILKPLSFIRIHR